MVRSARSDSSSDSRDSSNKHSTMVVAIVAMVALLAMFMALPDQSVQSGLSDISGNPVRDGEGAAPPAGGGTPTVVRPADVRTRIDQSGQRQISTWPTQEGRNPQNELSLPFVARWGARVGNAAIYCTPRFRLTPKNEDFCQFTQLRGPSKTVGKFAVFGMPNAWQRPTSGVRSIAVDVSKIANSGSGVVGFHIFYSSFPTPGESEMTSWRWAQYCEMQPNSDSMTCTKNFAQSVSVGKVMVARANWGANSPTPYITDIRVTTG